MSEPRYVSPMLESFTLGQSISEHSGVECYPAMRDDSEKRYIVKKISLPASQVQVEALLLTGVYRDADAVRAYYEDLANGVAREIRTLNALAEQRGFVPCDGFQVEPMEYGVGYEVHILSRYRKTLQRYMKRNAMTHLSALNLGIDLCAAMAVSREAGWVYVDLKPENIYLFGDQEYRIGDLGFVAMDSLKYASLPDRYRSVYTAPEVADAYSSLNATMDTYALGLVLYQVYNLGKLPFENEEGRKAWLEGLASGEALVPPVGADEEMAAIIAKACAYDPADRWQTPAELGHALISYMQRNGAEDIPIAAPVIPEPEVPEEPVEAESVEEAPAEEPVVADPVVEAPAEESAEEESVEEIPTEVSVEEEPVEEASADEPVEEESVEEVPTKEPVEEASVEEVPTEEPVEEEPVEEVPTEEPVEEESVEEIPDEEPAEAEPVEEIPAEEPADAEPVAESPANVEEDSIAADWIDLMDAFLAEEENTPVPPEDEPSLRELLGDEEEYLSEAEDLSEQDLSAETADMLNFAQELIEHEAPAPAVAPEPVDLPIPEPIPLETDEDEEEEKDIVLELPEEEHVSEPEAPAVLPVPEEEKKGSGIVKKLLSVAAALAVVAGLAFGAWYYYQNYYLQPINGFTYVGTARDITVTVDTPMDQSKLTVICKDTYGNAVTGTLENGSATFSDLVPGSQYIISLEPTGFNKLTGTTSLTYSTPAETKLMHLTAVTGQEAGSAIVSFGVEGQDCENWTLTWTAEGAEPQSVSFTGHTVTLNELTVGTEYTFTLSAPEDVLLVGENVITHTASELVQASNLSLAGYADGVISVTWTAPEGVDRWIVRCFDGAGYDQVQEVSGNTASFEGVTEGGKYTVEVIAATQTLAVRSEITADTNNISGFTATASGSTIELSWNYGGAVPEGGWKLVWSADGGPEHILTAEENKATLSAAAPGSVYTFTIQPPEGTSIAAASTTLETAAAGKFSANKLDSDTIIVEMFDVPTKNNWTYGTLQRAREQDTFKPGGKLALLYTVTKPYSSESKDFETIFVIRDADGKVISTASHARSWNEMWDNGYCTETVSNLPAEKGSYTLSIYIAGGKLAELPFTIN